MDRIKKIKIKQQDGTMSDYYPVGADAQNIDFTNGYSLDQIVGDINPDEDGTLEVQLSKVIKYYNTVADMKADTKLQEGDLVETMGYYEINDGGAAQYNIVDNSSKYYEELNNNLKAELIIKNNIINFRQLGAKDERASNFAHLDCKQYLQKYLNLIHNDETQHYELLIPSGIWCFSETIINQTNVTIRGEIEFCSNFNKTNGTIITALSNQDYVWRLGNNLDFSYETPAAVLRHVNIKDLTFSSGLYTAHLHPNSLFQINKACLYIDGICFSYFGDLNFHYLKGTGITITTSWELYFNILNFRCISDHTKPCMLFETCHNTPSAEHPNISACEFNSIMFEACNGNYIACAYASSIDNCIIHHINIEGSFYNTYEVGTISTPTISTEYDINESVFAIGNIGQLIIETINIELLGAYMHTYNGVKYIRSKIFEHVDSVDEQMNYAVLTINNIHSRYNTIPIYLIYQNNNSPINFRNKIIINNYQGAAEGLYGAPKFKCVKYSGLYINNIITSNAGRSLQLNNLMSDYTKCFSLAWTNWQDRTIVSDDDPETTLPINICVKRHPDNNNARIMYISNYKKGKISILAKVPSNISAQITFSFLQNEELKTKYTDAITGNDTYQWYDYDLSEENIDIFSPLYINISSSGSTNILFYEIIY